MKSENCSGGIRGFAAFIFAICILFGGIMIFAGCGDMGSYIHREQGVISVIIGFGTIITGGIVFSLFNGFAQLLDDVRALRDRYVEKTSQNS